MLRFGMPAQECPLCGSPMRLEHTETIVHIPGNPQASVRRLTEWICPDCDYFEEAEEEKT